MNAERRPYGFEVSEHGKGVVELAFFFNLTARNKAPNWNIRDRSFLQPL